MNELSCLKAGKFFFLYNSFSVLQARCSPPTHVLNHSKPTKTYLWHVLVYVGAYRNHTSDISHFTFALLLNKRYQNSHVHSSTKGKPNYFLVFLFLFFLLFSKTFLCSEYSFPPENFNLFLNLLLPVKSMGWMIAGIK